MSDSEITDTYASLSVHGLMPFAKDEGTGKLRFATIGKDAVEDCLKDPSELPDAQIDLFLFSSGHLEIWLDGIRELAGNAVDIVLPNMRWPQFALLVRHDKEARTGTTIDDVVALRDMRRNLSTYEQTHGELGVQLRAAEAKRLNDEATLDGFEAYWASETAALRGIDIVSIDSYRGGATDRLRFSVDVEQMRGTGPSYDLHKTDEGWTAQWHTRESKLDPDLLDLLDTAIAGAGGRRIEGGAMFSLASIDKTSVERLRLARTEINKAIIDLDKLQKGRGLVTGYLANKSLMKLVERAVAGFPVVVSSHRDTSQASPSTGTAVDVPFVHVGNAVNAGLLQSVMTVAGPTHSTFAILTSTPFAEMLIAGDRKVVDAMALDKATTRQEYEIWSTDRAGVKIADVVGRTIKPPERPMKALEKNVEIAKYEIGRWSTNRKAWAVLLAGYVHGIVELDAYGRLPGYVQG
jgi:hypothetical protein